MIWFTADTHFHHGNIIDYCDRPFYSITEHDEKLIENWNSVVDKADTVYHLGDFGFSPKREGVESLQKIAGKLKGKIILIKGNHDTNIDSVKRFETIKDYHVIHTNNTRFVLFHYPMRSWQFMNKGSIHLYGHCHSRMPPLYRSFDCGVDNVALNILGNGNVSENYQEHYRPISVKEVLTYASSLQLPAWAM